MITVSAHDAQLVGWTVAVAMTAAAWADAVTWLVTDAHRHPSVTGGQQARLRAVLAQAFLAWKQSGGTSAATFTVSRVRRDGPPGETTAVQLVVTPHTGHDRKPLAVISLNGQQ